MPNDIFAFSVPIFLRGHAILADLLRKAETHAAERKIAPSVLLTARLFPDMFPLTGQVQSACDTAKRATARLVGAEPPRFEDNEATFDELHDRIRRTSAYVESHAADGLPVDEDRKIEMKMGSIVISLTPREYLTRFALPNFYFHIATAYDILRHNGVVLGKRDYLGNMSSAQCISPGVRRVAVIRDPDLPVGSGQYGAMQSVAPSIGVELKPVNMRDPTEIERGIATIARSPNGGIVVRGSPFASKYRESIMTCRSLVLGVGTLGGKGERPSGC